MKATDMLLVAFSFCLGALFQTTTGFMGPAKQNVAFPQRIHRLGSGTSQPLAIPSRKHYQISRADSVVRWVRRDDFFEDDDFYDYEEDDYEPAPRKPRSRVPLLPARLSKALVAGVFVLGIGTGVTVDSAINTDPRDLASRDAIDRNAPNPNICQMYGSSAMVVDQRVFVTFNPFSLHVSQADTKPGCVLRPSNVVEVLQRKRGLLTSDDVETCKAGMNTWAFVGDLNDHPQLSCVYQSDDAQNEFLSNPKYGLGEDVYDDDRAAAAKASGKGTEAVNGPRVMSGTVQTIVTDRAK